MAVLLNINGTDIPQPSFPDGYRVGVMDIVKNAFRTPDNATTNVDYVAQKVKIEISYKYLSSADYAILLGLLKPGTNAGFFFTVIYIDPRTGTTTTGTFYAGDMTGRPFKFDNTTGDISWADVAVNLIEK